MVRENEVIHRYAHGVGLVEDGTVRIVSERFLGLRALTMRCLGRSLPETNLLRPVSWSVLQT